MNRPIGATRHESPAARDHDADLARIDVARGHRSSVTDQQAVTAGDPGDVVAHRGASATETENTLPAFETAVAALILLPLLRRISASSPGISNDISMGGQDEAALSRVPHQALASMLVMNKLIRRDLAKISAPILLYRSVNDHVLGPQSAALIKAEVRGPYEQRDLPRSFHVATLDHEAGDIIDGSLAFVKEHTIAGSPDADGHGR